jgi:hypothetical protein
VHTDLVDNSLHVHPVDDLAEHELTDDCWCGPEQRLVPRADGSDGWLVIHHSLDGREQHEQAC